MTLLLMMLAVLMLVLAATMLLMAVSLLQPPRMSDGKAVYLLKRITPADLSLPFQAVDFHVKSAGAAPLQLAAWWIGHPAGGRKTVVLIHGYADAKVGAIAWAPLWQQLGFNVLAYDQRAHGESGGRYSTGGYHEQADLSQIIDQLRQRWPDQSRTLVLFGISLGAAPALSVAGQRDDVSAVVAECPFRDFATAVRGLSKLLGLPLPSLAGTTLRLAAWLSAADLHGIDTPGLIRASSCPVLVIQSAIDPFVSTSDIEEIEQAVVARGDCSRCWLVANATHLRALETDPKAYKQQLSAFLEAGSL